MLIWRHLLSNYLKIFFLTLLSFIAILLVWRLEDIAQFIALGAKIITIIQFILYQIPYILPLAAAISSLLASLLCFQKLSHSQELSALRASGLSLGFLLTPLLIASAVISFSTFYLSSEFATICHLQTRKMVYDITSVNPLLLLSKNHAHKLKMMHIQMNATRQGKEVQDLCITFYNKQSDSLNAMMIKELRMDDAILYGRNVSLIATEKEHDALIIENQESLQCSAHEFAKLLKKRGWRLANDHLKLSLLRMRKKEFQKQLAQTQNPEFQKKINQCNSEITRRFSIGFAPLLFTLMGAAFGIQISRRETKKHLLFVLVLATLSLITFFIAKEFDHLVFLSSFLFLTPHIFVSLLSICFILRAKRGIE